MNRESNRLRAEDLQAAKAAGWSEEALYDAITVCALFNFYNKWIDATGVRDMPAAAYEASGRRLATRGDRKSTRLNSSHANISYAVFCLKKKTKSNRQLHVDL